MVTMPAAIRERHLALHLPAMRLVLLTIAAAGVAVLAWQMISPAASLPVQPAQAIEPVDLLSDCVPGYCPLPMPLFP
jgi:hypothetical protein